MNRYKIYAGLGGGFGGKSFQGIYEFKNDADAEQAAYTLAVEEYESYAGCHGLLDYEGAYEDLLESGLIDPEEMSEDEINDAVETHYTEYMESWLDYEAKLVVSYNDVCGEDEDDSDYDYDDDDADCFCDD